ncbi:hypothetical protein LTR51_000350 [Lithohypha guttulata]|uniref:Glutamine amidotransferase domain-containing protein n=1 Tax=Lithohypha guttulata TaxID=1690604 RepID=A0AAN7Y6N0_9EURO|nr:hypothetical protein LTR51_000350 [Lithohypha guttulata]KAK5085541.1 hypothetical protein LTR05_004826 [Lithohypha guttulata]
MKARTRLAILECDTPLPGTAAQYGGYGGVFKALLNAGAKAEGHTSAEDILDISTHQIESDLDNYPSIADVDALLLTGSPSALQSKRVRVIGVCFGHQIVARALGVEVGRNPDGWEAAVNNVQLSKKGQELFRVDNLRIHQMHRDIAFAYPEGFESLGSSPVCSVQGMYSPRHVVTVQGHPEFTGPIMKEIVETRHKTGIFDDEAYKTHAKNVDLPHDGVAVGAAFIRFLQE